MLPDMGSTYELALRNDLQLQSLGLEKEGAGIDIDIAKAGKRPKISLNAGVMTGYNAPGGSFGQLCRSARQRQQQLSLHHLRHNPRLPRHTQAQGEGRHNVYRP